MGAYTNIFSNALILLKNNQLKILMMKHISFCKSMINKPPNKTEKAC